MPTFDEQVQQAALELINSMVVQAEQEKWENAESFIALTTDGETHKIHINGTFPDAPTALAWAEQSEADLNRGMPEGEAPYVVVIFPVEAVS
jgi:hypothetical protein